MRRTQRRDPCAPSLGSHISAAQICDRLLQQHQGGDSTNEYWAHLQKMRCEFMPDLLKFFEVLSKMSQKNLDHPQVHKAIDFRNRLKQTIDSLSQDRSDPRYANVRG
jgi:hypothetical protein